MEAAGFLRNSGNVVRLVLRRHKVTKPFEIIVIENDKKSKGAGQEESDGGMLKGAGHEEEKKTKIETDNGINEESDEESGEESGGKSGGESDEDDVITTSDELIIEKWRSIMNNNNRIIKVNGYVMVYMYM